MSYIEDMGYDSFDPEKEADIGFWTTLQGIRLKIEDMETNHIFNCINMLRRHPDFKDNPIIQIKINEFEKEINKRVGF